MKIKLSPGAIAPTRAHKTDAGEDLYSMETKVIPANGNAAFDTGVSVAIPEGQVGLVLPRSGLNFKKQTYPPVGVIDSDYRGPIAVKLYNAGERPILIRTGDRIAQLVRFRCIIEENEIVDDLPETKRGSGGFGSTGA